MLIDVYDLLTRLYCNIVSLIHAQAHIFTITTITLVQFLASRTCIGVYLHHKRSWAVA